MKLKEFKFQKFNRKIFHLLLISPLCGNVWVVPLGKPFSRSRSSGRFLVKLCVPFVIVPVLMPTIDADVMVGVVVEVPMIK